MAISAAEYRPENGYPDVNSFGVVAGIGYVASDNSANENDVAGETVQHQTLIVAPPNFEEGVTLYEIDQLIQGRDFYGAIQRILDASTKEFSEENHDLLSKYASEALEGLIAEGGLSEASRFLQDLFTFGINPDSDVFEFIGHGAPYFMPENPVLAGDADPLWGPSQQAKADRDKFVRNKILQSNPWELDKLELKI